MGWREIRQKVEELNADVFGISSSFTPYHQEALEVARIIKEWDKKKIVVMGGAHVSCAPESVLESPWVDYVVLGEGEIRFPLLLKQIDNGVPARVDEIDGIGYRREGKIRITPLQHFIDDPDRLPYPARELFRPDGYRHQGAAFHNDHYQQGMSSPVCLLLGPSSHGNGFPDTISGEGR